MRVRGKFVRQPRPKALDLWSRLLFLGSGGSTSSASKAHASTTCSALSSTSSTSFVAKYSTMLLTTVRSGCSSRPSAIASILGTRSGSLRAANSTSHTPSAKSPTTSVANRSAKRVLPQPPEPVSVNRRVDGTSCLRAARSRSRPMKLVNCGGRLWRGSEFPSNSAERVSAVAGSIAKRGTKR